MIFNNKYYIADKISSINSFFTNKFNNSVLLYHSVKAINKLSHSNLDNIDISSFTEQMLFLKNNYHDRIAQFDKNLTREGSISISFDDGYKDNLDIVFPIVEKYKIPIIIFICPSLIGTDGYLSISDLMFLGRQQFIQIGSHGYSHSKLKNLNNEIIIKEILDSKNWLEDKLSFEISSMSFPHGSYDYRVLKILKDSQLYKYAANSVFKTFNSKNIDNFMIPRISIWHLDALHSFENKIKGSWDWMSFQS